MISELLCTLCRIILFILSPVILVDEIVTVFNASSKGIIFKFKLVNVFLNMGVFFSYRLVRQYAKIYIISLYGIRLIL